MDRQREEGRSVLFNDTETAKVSHLLCINMKIKTYTTVILSVALHEYKTWSPTLGQNIG
jgi:hypothetical protein